MVDWSKQLYWEDVNEGDEVPPVSVALTVQRLIMLAGANRDFNAIHHNRDAARAGGAPDIYINNYSCQGIWERTVREYIGLRGVIKRAGPFRMRIFNTPGETVVTSGKVVKKWQEGGENFVELEIRSEHSKGTSIGPGGYLVTLPSKSSR